MLHVRWNPLLQRGLLYDLLLELGREGRGAGTPGAVRVVVDGGENKIGHDVMWYAVCIKQEQQ